MRQDPEIIFSQEIVLKTYLNYLHHQQPYTILMKYSLYCSFVKQIIFVIHFMNLFNVGAIAS